MTVPWAAMVETSPLNSSLKTFSFGFGASMTTCWPSGRIRLGFPASEFGVDVADDHALPGRDRRPPRLAWMLVSASGSTSGAPAEVLHSCCPSAADAGMADFRTWAAVTVGVVEWRPR